MKVVILAGGLGTRLSEETVLKPKPMVEIGGMPILWHIMKTYSNYGFNDFVVCLGYKGFVVKEYFANYFIHKSDVTMDLKTNSVEVHDTQAEPWKITLVDTGDNSMTGGRIKRIEEYVKGEKFLCTYGDGVANIDLKALTKFHNSHGKTASVTAVRPTNRFGAMQIDENNTVTEFAEKPRAEKWVNGGYFIFEPGIFKYLDSECVLEKEPLEKLASNGELKSYKHEGFWQPMDTYRESQELNELWDSNKAPWKIW
jgi:glucose-1-phosphate cytidylyltransferase